MESAGARSGHAPSGLPATMNPGISERRRRKDGDKQSTMAVLLSYRTVKSQPLSLPCSSLPSGECSPGGAHGRNTAGSLEEADGMACAVAAALPSLPPSRPCLRPGAGGHPHRHASCHLGRPVRTGPGSRENTGRRPAGGGQHHPGRVTEHRQCITHRWHHRRGRPLPHHTLGLSLRGWVSPGDRQCHRVLALE